MQLEVDSRIPLKVDAGKRIPYFLHNPSDKCQMRRKDFEESFGVVTEKLIRL